MSCSSESREGEAKTPSGSSIQRGRNYEKVVADFKNQGFLDIAIEPIEDLIFDSLSKDGEVEDVSVGGDVDYFPDKWFPADTPILIRYHTLRRAESSDEGNDRKETSTTPGHGMAQPTETPHPPAPQSESATFEVHYIDVGQADSPLVICDGETMLIDGGNAENSDLIFTYLKKMSIDHLKYIVCTHAHEDHVGGLAGALNYATVDYALCPVTSYDNLHPAHNLYRSLSLPADTKGQSVHPVHFLTVCNRGVLHRI